MNLPALNTKPLRLRSILVLAAVVLVALVWPRGISGQGLSYEYEVERSSGGRYLIDVDLVDPDNDFLSFKQENDDAISDWLGDPTSAPALDGRRVRVTFTEPRSAVEVMEIVGPHVAEYIDYRLMGSSVQDEIERTYDGIGPIDPALIGVPIQDFPVGLCRLDPQACDPSIFSGVIDLSFRLTGGVDALSAIRDDPRVFLVDCSGILILEALEAEHPDVVDRLEQIDLLSPMYDSGGRVSLP